MFISDIIDVKFNYEEELIKCHNIKNGLVSCNIEVHNSINEIIKYLKLCSSSEKNMQYHVLVTGSLKLVGGVLEILQL